MVWAPHTLVSWGGQLWDASSGGSSLDVWSNNVRVAKAAEGATPDGPLSDPAAYMASIATPLSNWYTSSYAQISSWCSLDWLKVNNIGSDGKYSDESTTNVHDYTSPPRGDEDPHGPGFTCCALSWTTAIVRGPACRGRIYPPNNCWASTGGIRVDGTYQGLLVTGAQHLLTLLAAGVSGSDVALPVVASSKNAAIQGITGVRVGNVIDVQRRRKNAVTEEYASGVWPTS